MERSYFFVPRLTRMLSYALLSFSDKIFYFGYLFKTKSNHEPKPGERRTLWICPDAESVSTGAITRQPMCTVQNHHSGLGRRCHVGMDACDYLPEVSHLAVLSSRPATPPAGTFWTPPAGEPLPVCFNTPEYLRRHGKALRSTFG